MAKLKTKAERLLEEAKVAERVSIEKIEPSLTEECISRIKNVMDERSIRTTELAEMIHWPAPRLSKILTGVQKVSIEDVAVISNALGYPAEAFMATEFDLDKYEILNQPLPLKKCIETVAMGIGSDEEKKMVQETMPYSIRRTLRISTNDFSFHTGMFDNTSLTDPFGNEEKYSSYPEIMMMARGADYERNVTPGMGYWFDSERRYAVLSIICVNSHRNVSNIANESLRNYFKSFLEKPSEDITLDLRKQRVEFSKRFYSGEVISTIYNLMEELPDEEQLEKDLKQMFSIYQKLVYDSANQINTTYWSLYKSAQKESTKSEGNEDVTKLVFKFAEEKQAKQLRKVVISQNAVVKANYTCEINVDHTSFIGKDGKPYVEAHHLIPLKFQNKFDVAIDVEANVIALCPNCHKQIHMGTSEAIEEMLVKLYYSRKEELENVGIKITLGQLLDMYNL